MLPSALSHVEGRPFASAETERRQLAPENEVWRFGSFGAASLPLRAGVPGLFCLGRCERSAGGAGSSVASRLRSVVTHNGAPLLPPVGFHFKSPAFVQKCVCSLILFGNYVKQKRMNGEENHSSSLPTLQPHPIATSFPLPLSPAPSLPLSLSSSAYSAADANDLPLCILMQGLSTLSLSSTYKCALIASSPSGLFSCLFEICRLISTSLAKSLQ